MKPASDERREVAARLREYVPEINGMRDFAMFLNHWVGVGNANVDGRFSVKSDRKTAEMTLEKLSDLMDPTCRPEPCDGPDRSGVRMLACPECGLACSEGFWAMPDVRFCPRCGARCVMDGGED